MVEYISLGSNCSVTYQLNKYGLRICAYPFDWIKINITQLNNILQKDFDDFAESLEFKKISTKHEYFGFGFGFAQDENINEHIDENINEHIKTDSIVLTNKYNIKFAHEITKINEIENFKSRIKTRIDRFKNLSSNNKINHICFIRVEINPIKLSWIVDIQNLIRLLKIYVDNDNFKLILIINSENKYEEYFPEFVKIYKFGHFTSDWKMDELNWNEILNG